MSAAVVSSASSAPILQRTRATASSAAQAYAALQYNTAQQTGQVLRHHGGRASASSSASATPAPTPNAGGALNILV